ncbi:MAG: LuxR C-terminal-related transcriptional regulator [Chloroflexota bacterium]
MHGTILTVLIAEPSTIVRAGLRALLHGKEGLAVVGETGDGSGLLRTVAQLKPDVLLLGSDSPDPPMYRVLAEVMSVHPGLKVMVLADPQEVPAAIALLEAGATGCILKSDRPEELVRGIRAIAAGELALSDTVARSLLQRQARRPPSPADALSEREREILGLLTAGLSNKEIAQKLYLSVRTVEVHLRNIYSKLGVRSRLEAVTHTVRHGVASPVSRSAEHAASTLSREYV